MSISAKAVLAVIPARGGSKGVPHKNLLVLDGSTLVARAVGCALATPSIDLVVISTDDPDIADEAQAHGASFFGIRPRELASDTAQSVDVWRHEWLVAERQTGHEFDVSVLLEPTSPLRTPADIEATLAEVGARGREAALTVSRVPGHFTPEKTLLVGQDRTVTHYLGEEGAISIRQLIAPYYHRNGACYAAARSQIVDRRSIVSGDCAAVVIERPMVNIDDELDLKLVSLLLDST